MALDLSKLSWIELVGIILILVAVILFIMRVTGVLGG